MNRRELLAIGGCAACALALGACTHTNQARIVSAPSTEGEVRLRLAEQPELSKPGGAIKLRPPGLDDTILLWRVSDSELAATSIVCTHLGCEVEVAQGGQSLACPCHGSKYGADGAVHEGPAKRPLRKYPVVVQGDEIAVRIA